jgi:hypothetical protein
MGENQLLAGNSRLLDAPPRSIDQPVLGKIYEILQPPRIAVSLRNGSLFSTLPGII